MSEVRIQYTNYSHPTERTHAVGWVHSLTREGSVWLAEAAVAKGQNHRDLALKVTDYTYLDIPVELPDSSARKLILASYHGMHPDYDTTETTIIAQLFDEHDKHLKGERSEIVTLVANGLEQLTITAAAAQNLGHVGCLELSE